MEVTPQIEPTQWAFPVVESSQVSEVRRRGAALARRLDFDETRAGALAIVVTEIGNNLAKHAQQGQIVLRALQGGDGNGVEVMSLDRGPGIRDLAESLRDGYSTSGTPGTGLGAIRRQADQFDLHSVQGRGTALVARIWAHDRPMRRATLPATPAFAVGAVCLPIHGEEAPGDAWQVFPAGSGTRFLVVDGVGHGRAAAEAAATAIGVAEGAGDWPLAELTVRLHEALRSGRGAVAAIAEIAADGTGIRFAGVGNVSAVIWSVGRPQNMVSMNGTLGHGTIRAREFSYGWPEESLLVLHSDGLGTRWSIDDYPGLSVKDPSLVAGVLYRDFARGRDDVTVLVARRSKPA